MVNGADEIGVRGSICWSVFITGAGAPGGVRLPCPNAEWKVTNEETMVLRNTLSNLQMAFVEASGTAGPAGTDTAAHPGSPQATPLQPMEQPPQDAAQQSPPITSSEPEPESRKKFSKSYGP